MKLLNGRSLHGYVSAASFLIAFSFIFFIFKLQSLDLICSFLIDRIMNFKVIEWMFIAWLLILLCKSQFRSDLTCFQSYVWSIWFLVVRLRETILTDVWGLLIWFRTQIISIGMKNKWNTYKVVHIAYYILFGIDLLVVPAVQNTAYSVAVLPKVSWIMSSINEVGVPGCLI